MFVIRIVDDDPGIHDSLSLIFDLLELPMRHYFSGEEFLRADLLSDPGCLILDLNLGNGLDGRGVQAELRARRQSLPIIFLTAYGNIETAVESMEEGAVTFLTKPVDTDKLLRTIERIRSNPSDQTAVERVRALDALLTEREKDVLRLLKESLTCRAIALRLGLSLRTVEFYRAGIMRKAQCANAKELMALLEKATRI